MTALVRATMDKNLVFRAVLTLITLHQPHSASIDAFYFPYITPTFWRIVKTLLLDY